MRGTKPVGSILCTLLLSVLPLYGNAQTYQTGSGHAEFTSHTPMFSFEGSSDSLNGTVNLSDSTVNFQLSVKTLDTGNGKRNRDMLKTLEAEKYPFAKFKGKIISSFNPDTSVKQEVKVKGEFTVHGTTQILTIPGTMQFEGNQLTISAKWSQNLTDYNIDPPSILFYSVKDRQNVRVEATLQPIEESNE